MIRKPTPLVVASLLSGCLLIAPVIQPLPLAGAASAAKASKASKAKPDPNAVAAAEIGKLLISRYFDPGWGPFDAAIAANDLAGARTALQAVVTNYQAADTLFSTLSITGAGADLWLTVRGYLLERTNWLVQATKQTTVESMSKFETDTRPPAAQEQAVDDLINMVPLEQPKPAGRKLKATGKALLDDRFHKIDRRRWYLDELTTKTRVTPGKGELTIDQIENGQAIVLTIDRSPDPLGSDQPAITVEADIILPDDVRSAGGVVCRQLQKDNKSYWGGIGPGGRVTIFKSGSTTRLNPTGWDRRLAYQSATVKRTVGAVNHVRLDCSSDPAGGPVTLRLSVNGAVAMEAVDSDDPLPPGPYGIYAESPGTTNAIRFLRFTVSVAK